MSSSLFCPSGNMYNGEAELDSIMVSYGIIFKFCTYNGELGGLFLSALSQRYHV